MQAPVPQPPQEAPVSTTKPKKRAGGPTDDGPDENWTKAPNEILILFSQGKLQGLVQAAVILLIMQKTWGDHVNGRPEFARIPHKDFAEAAGPKTDLKTIRVAVADALKRGMIVVPDNDRCKSAKHYKVNYRNWKNVAPYETPAQHAEPETEPETEEESEPAAAPPPRQKVGVKLTVRPGKKPVAVPLKLDLERIEYLCEGPEPVEIKTETGNGVLFVTVSKTANEKRTGPGVHTLRFQNAPEQNQQVSDFEPGKTAISEKPPFPDADLTRCTTFTNAQTMRLWGKGADADLIGQIMKANDGAPPEYFENRVVLKFPTPQSARRHTSGLLIKLAADGNKDWKAAMELQKAAPPPEPEMTLEEERAWLEKVRIEDPEGYELMTRKDPGA